MSPTLTTADEVAALIPKASKRPDVWYQLVDHLLALGFTYTTDSHEWVRGTERGRSAWAHDSRTAWLAMPYDRGTQHYLITVQP